MKQNTHILIYLLKNSVKVSYNDFAHKLCYCGELVNDESNLTDGIDGEFHTINLHDPHSAICSKDFLVILKHWLQNY